MLYRRKTYLKNTWTKPGQSKLGKSKKLDKPGQSRVRTGALSQGLGCQYRPGQSWDKATVAAATGPNTMEMIKIKMGIFE